MACSVVSEGAKNQDPHGIKRMGENFREAEKIVAAAREDDEDDGVTEPAVQEDVLLGDVPDGDSQAGKKRRSW